MFCCIQSTTFCLFIHQLMHFELSPLFGYCEPYWCEFHEDIFPVLLSQYAQMSSCRITRWPHISSCEELLSTVPQKQGHLTFPTAIVLRLHPLLCGCAHPCVYKLVLQCGLICITLRTNSVESPFMYLSPLFILSVKTSLLISFVYFQIRLSLKTKWSSWAF